MTGTCNFKNQKGCEKKYASSFSNGCAEFDSSAGKVGKMAFKKQNLADVYVHYGGSALVLDKQAFSMANTDEGTTTLHLGASCPGGCAAGTACTAGSSGPSCPGSCDTRQIDGASQWNTHISDILTYCDANAPAPTPAVSPSPSPPPPSPSPPAAAPVVCGPGTTLDADSSTCKINCDESNPPGRRFSESPFAPADADASDTARESREQSARAGKAIDSYLASQPDLDDALRSALSSHLERFAAEILWFTEEE